MSEHYDRACGAIAFIAAIVVLAGIAGTAQAAVDDGKVDDAIRRGVEYLRCMQRMDGSWRSPGHNTCQGHTALCALALRKSGLKPDHPSIRKALHFLQNHHPNRTYAVSVLLMLLEAVDPKKYEDWIEQCGEMLADTQKNRLWSYPAGATDMSNTQYAALGLNAAANCGFKFGQQVWKDLLEGVTEAIEPDGGWGYRGGNDSTGAMTCAGLTCLLVCQAQLEKNGRRKLSRNEFANYLERGLAWMDRHFRADRNPKPHVEKPGAARWTYYYLYGIERVGTLSRRRTFGEHDWYDEGANWLLKRQGKEGNWSSAYGEGEWNTAFAVLFLSRATAGARTRGGVQTRIMSKSGGKTDIFIGCNRKNPGYLWIESWSNKVAEKFGIDGGTKAIRVDKVEYYEGDTLLGTINEDPTDNRITRYPLEYRFEGNGLKELYARVTCRSRHGTIVETFESGKLKLLIHDNLTALDQSLMDDVSDNLMGKGDPLVTASSQWEGSNWSPSFAVDGWQSWAWLSAKPDKDSAPWIQIAMDIPVRSNRLKLTHVMESNQKTEEFGRATQIRVLINRGAQKFVVDLEPDATKKYEIPFKTTRVRELRIEMLDRVKGKRYTAAGFSEIELFLVR